MTKRKSKRVALKTNRFKPKLDTIFSCPFCSHEKSVDCKIERSKAMASLSCRVCQAGYQTTINSLTEPIDVYGEWVDAIAAKEANNKDK